jgi:phosphate transport system protein
MAANIAQRAITLNELPLLKPYLDIPQMAVITRAMIRESLDAFVHETLPLAIKVKSDDEIIDQMNEQVFRELLTFMLEDPQKIHTSLMIVQISKNLERIADHATGIADMVIYMITGNSVRHQLRVE